MAINPSTPVPRKRKMSREELQAIINVEIENTQGRETGELQEERRENLDFYLGKPFGDELDDHSQFVSSDVQDVIEEIMPEMMEIFAGGDEIVTYKPVGPEDEEMVEQARDYCDLVLWSDNDGFVVVHDTLKTGLLQRNGFTKTYWDTSEKVTTHTYTGLNLLQMTELQSDPEVEILEFEEGTQEIEPGVVEPVYAAKVKRTDSSGRIAVCTVPPERFVISRRARDLSDAILVGDWERYTVSDLMVLGFKMEEIRKLPTEDDQDLTEEHLSRFEDEEYPIGENNIDPAMREVRLYEVYVRADWNGDGHAKLYQVYCGGSGDYMVLRNPNNGDWAMEVEDHPYSSATPIKMPYKLFGRAVADLVKDIQLVKSTVSRQVLDNMYRINNARTEIAASHSTNQTIEDWLNNVVGGVVRTKTPGGINPIQTTPIIDQAFPIMEYFDGVREIRTGVGRTNPTNDAQNAASQTLGGLQAIMGKAQKRKLLIARTFAETFFRDLYRKILRLTISHQEKPRVVQLRNKWVEVDPRHWNAEMDIQVAVGLGHGTKEQQIQEDLLLLQTMGQGAQMGAAMGVPLFSPKNFYNVIKRLVSNMGWKNPEDVVTDPESPEGQQLAQMIQQQQGPDPKMLEAQARIELEKVKTQAGIDRDAQKAQAEVQKDAAQAAAEAAKDAEMAQADAQRELIKVETDREKTASEIEIAKYKAEEEMAIQRWLAEQRIEIERMKAENQAEVAKMQADQAVSQSERTFAAAEKAKRAQPKAGSKKAEPKKTEKPQPAPVINIKTGGKRSISVVRDADGKISGAEVEDKD